MSGDFNELVDPEEKLGGFQRTEEECKDFTQILKACGMFEIQNFGYQYSWYGQRNNDLVQCRLDMFVANQEWSEMFEKASASYLHRVSSDHSPLITCLIEEQRRERIGQHLDMIIGSSSITVLKRKLQNIGGTHEEGFRQECQS